MLAKLLQRSSTWSTRTVQLAGLAVSCESWSQRVALVRPRVPVPITHDVTTRRLPAHAQSPRHDTALMSLPALISNVYVFQVSNLFIGNEYILYNAGVVNLWYAYPSGVRGRPHFYPIYIEVLIYLKMDRCGSNQFYF